MVSGASSVLFPSEQLPAKEHTNVITRVTDSLFFIIQFFIG